MSMPRVRAFVGFLAAFMAGSFHTTVAGAESTAAHSVFIGQPMLPQEEGQWVEVEGIVTFVGIQGGQISLELGSEAGHMQVTVAGGDVGLAGLLLGSHIRAEGVCHGAYDLDGKIVSSLSTPGREEITILQLPQETWQRYPLRTIADVTRTIQTIPPGQIVHLRGEILGTETNGTFRLADGTGELEIHFIQGLSKPVGTDIEVLVAVGREGSKPNFLNEVSQAIGKGNNKSSPLPVLTTTEQVRWLTPAEANRRYPVKLRAVVTFLLGQPSEAAGNLQDAAGGIYAWHLVSSVAGIILKPGDFCEIEGETSAGAFSPGIDCRKLTVLGRGQFPEPARPGWNELANGSLDAQWVEVEGIVLSASDQHLEIRTQGGRIACFVLNGHNLERFLNAVSLVRGVVVADWDQSRHVQGLHLNVPSEEFISLEIPPLADPFSLPTKQIKDLLIYNRAGSAFRREKVIGGIVGAWEGVYYLMSGTNGLRLFLQENLTPATGDTVEAVGFPEIDTSRLRPWSHCGRLSFG